MSSTLLYGRTDGLANQDAFQPTNERHSLTFQHARLPRSRIKPRTCCQFPPFHNQDKRSNITCLIALQSEYCHFALCSRVSALDSCHCSCCCCLCHCAVSDRVNVNFNEQEQSLSPVTITITITLLPVPNISCQIFVHATSKSPAVATLVVVTYLSFSVIVAGSTD